MVVKVHKENGESVRKGDLLVSLDGAVLKDNLNSAEESFRAATQSLDGAERQYQRMKSLQAQGMVSTQGLEESEMKRNTAQSEFVASKARVAAAKQQGVDRNQNWVMPAHVFLAEQLISSIVDDIVFEKITKHNFPVIFNRSLSTIYELYSEMLVFWNMKKYRILGASP